MKNAKNGKTVNRNKIVLPVSSSSPDSSIGLDDDEGKVSPAIARLNALAGYVQDKSQPGQSTLAVKRKGKWLAGSRVRKRKPRAIPTSKVKVSAQLLPIREISQNTGAETKEKDITSLWQANSIEAVDTLWKSWNRTFRRKCRAAIKKRILDDATRNTLNAIFTGKATSTPILTNEKACRMAYKHLHAELVALARLDLDFEVALVTIISGDGATSHAKPVIELKNSQDKVQATLRAMSPNFFGITELVLFNSHSHPDGGQLVQRHEHALIFGPGVLAKARAVAAMHMSHFVSNATGAPQIDIRKVKADEVNLARMCAYLLKPPHKSMTWRPPSDGKPGHMHQSEKGDRFLRYLRMAMIRSMLTVDDVTFGGGEGQRIRSQIIKLLRPTCEADASPHTRLIHPDAIGAFCVELAKQLGKADWTLPVIAKRK